MPKPSIIQSKFYFAITGGKIESYRSKENGLLKQQAVLLWSMCLSTHFLAR